MKKIFGIMVMAALVVLSACKKDEKPGQQGQMQVRLTDAPGPYSHVYVEIVGVEVHLSGGPSWMPLLINPGTYDLLDLQNGVDTVLAPPQVIPAGHITQMRLVLGSNNYVVDTMGVSTPLKTPSGETSGLKININETVPVGVVYDVLLDFDANQSIVVQGNGDLLLKPVLRRL